MKYTRLLIGVILVLATVTAIPTFAQDDTPTRFSVNQPEIGSDSDVGFARFVNTSVDVGSVDIYVEDSDTPLVEGLAFGDATDFLMLPVTDQAYVVRSSETGEDLFRLPMGMSSNMSWLIAPTGLREGGSFMMEPINIIRTDIPEDQAVVRVVNYVWGGPQLSIQVQGENTPFQNLAYLNWFDQTAEPGTYNLEVVNESGEVIAETSADLEAHKVYQMLIVGEANGKTEILVLETEPYTADVRFVNERGEPVDVYVRPGEEQLVTNLADGATSDYFTLDSDSVTFVAYVPGTGTSGQELTAGYLYLSPHHQITVTIDSDGEMNVEKTPMVDTSVNNMTDAMGENTTDNMDADTNAMDDTSTDSMDADTNAMDDNAADNMESDSDEMTEPALTPTPTTTPESPSNG